MPVFFLLATLFLCIFFYSYLPALSGPFVLDDDPNFSGLSYINDLTSAVAYSYNGPAGLRWLSYLSFTLPVEIDAWKNANAFPFKLINLIIHTTNCALVFLFLRKLFHLENRSTPYPLVWAACIAIIWAIHPIHVNTVLYSVQRMTLLAGTAVLVGIYYHLVFLEKYRQQAISNSAWIVYTAIIWLITAIGILFKESAILLPLLILSTYSLISNHPFSRLQITLSLISPYLLLVAYLIVDNRLGFHNRSYTMEERLLSELVILKEYVIKIIHPSFSSFSLYYDDFKPVKSPGESRFAVAVLFWISFIGLAKITGKWMPAMWFGCLWFLAGHSLESTIIPLELYFDHRNYLPSIGILVMMSTVAGYLANAVKTKHIRLLLAILAIAITVRYAILLKQETRYWHNSIALSTSLIQKHPDSMRATQYYIENLVKLGRYKEAIIIINYLHQKFGVSASNAIFQVGFSCISQPNVTIHHQTLINDLKTLPFDMSVSHAMRFLLDVTKEKACPSLSREMFDHYINSLLSNPRQRKHYHNLVYLMVSSHIQQKDPATALEYSFKLRKSLLSPQFLFLQMHLSLITKNITAAESVYRDINAFDKTQKILYKDDIQKIKLALERLQNETKN